MVENNYVVYFHKTRDDHIFYVGHGKISRAYKLERSKRKGTGTFRGKAYSDYVESINYQYDVEIFKSNLSKEDAIKIETMLYDTLKLQLVNHNRPSGERLMSMDMFDDFLYYDSTSKSCLRWKVDVGKCRANSEAGCLRSSDSYYQVKINNKAFLVHRIIVILFGHSINGMVVDHIDGDTMNNKIENLRVVSQKENMSRKMITPTNVSGRVGVSTVAGERFIAKWVECGNLKTKSFSINKYGYEMARRLAIDYRKIKEIEHGIVVNRTKTTKLNYKGKHMENNKLSLAIAKLAQSSQLFNEIAGKDKKFSKEAICNQIKLVNEEVLEMNDAFLLNNPVELLDAVLDTIVVVTGLAQQLVSAGVDFDSAAELVSENNLSKFTKDSEIASQTVEKLNKDGISAKVEFNHQHDVYLVKNSQEKICKPVTFKSVDLTECVPAGLIINGFIGEQ